jgi:hypothetical protein
MSSRTSRILLVGVFSLAVAGFASAQDKRDLLEEVKQRQQVEIQRVEADFQKIYDEAKAASVKEPAKAIALLQDFRDKLTSNADIPADKRDAMLRRIKIAIDAYTGRVTDLTTQPLPSPPRTTTDKKTDEKVAREVADQAKKNVNQTAKNLEASNQVKALREHNYVLVQMDLDKTNIPQVEDITFPADWAEKSKKRLEKQQPLTKEEKKILEALNTPMTVELENSTLEDVIKYLQDKTGVNIVVPQTILEERNITYKVGVSVNLKNVTLRTILKKTLADVGLVYIVKDNVIQVTTEERAKQTLTTRTYYMGDVLALTDLRMPPFARKAQAISTINDMIGIIVSTVEPNSWWVNGGPGRIVFDPTSMTLIVTNTAEVHYMLNGKR